MGRGRNRRGVTHDQVRELFSRLPGVEESASRGWSAFRVNGKIIGRFRQDEESIALKCDYSTREVLMGTNPESFYLTDHYRCYPWVLVRLSKVERGLLQSLIEDAWRKLAPKRLLLLKN